MSRRRDIEQRLALFGELASIMNAMRSFALVELRRLAQREEAQQQAQQTLELAMCDVGGALPEPPPGPGDIWVALGSARGFCAGLNDEVRRCWQEQASAALATIAVGERLAALMPPAVVAVPGPVTGADAVAAIDRILAALAQARRRVGDNAGLVLCYRGEAGAAVKRLLPLPRPTSGTDRLPLTNEAPSAAALGVAEHYLFHTLLALLLGALRVENRLRLMQMETAQRHIERASAELTRTRNQLRQDEIVEELELIEHGGMPD